MGQNDINVIFKPGYKNEKDVRQLCRYVVGKGKNSDKEIIALVGSEGVSKKPDKACTQIITTNRLVGKGKGRQVYHVIISFRKGCSITEVSKAAKSIARIYTNYSCLYAIHTSTENLHIHLVFGAVNIMTGKKLHLDKVSFMKHIETIKREAYQTT